jgi:hypothetical protein
MCWTNEGQKTIKSTIAITIIPRYITWYEATILSFHITQSPSQFLHSNPNN